MTTFGIDISEFQDGLSLAQAKAEGFEFVIIRTNDGTYRDRVFQSHLADAEANGLLVAAYWYLRAESEGSTISQQVDVIDSQMGGRRDIPVWIDVESVDGGRLLNTGQEVWEAKRELERRGYHVPGIYSGAWAWENLPGGEPSMDGLGYLWCSSYGRNLGGYASALYEGDGGDNHPGWGYPLGDRTPDLLQFGSNGHVAGFESVDVDAFRGSLDELRAIFHGDAVPAPAPAPAPARDPHAFPGGEEAVGNIWADVKDIRAQLTGSRYGGEYPGWKQLGTNSAGDGLTLVDGVAAARRDIAALQRSIDELNQKIDRLGGK